MIKEELKELLKLCSSVQQLMFKRMYSHNHLELDIDEVVDNMDKNKINHALFQVENTLKNVAKKYNL